ncbi:MAG TPA: hypothetical protein VF173_36145 [Thermoanaerobaculia bacterium]|nr:hypothetical protein [Thermoanaerobaculia bacterium]
MSHSGEESATTPGADLQQAFDQAAGDLGLNLEPISTGADDTVTIGMAVAFFSRTVDVRVEPSPPPVDSSDDDAIRALITGYESLDPTLYKKHWRDYATDPHLGVGLSWVGLVNEHAVDRWLETKALADAIAAYPPHSPRKLQIHDLRIMYIGDTRAVATYQVEEHYKNDRTTVGNHSCIVFRIHKVGWRIAVATKGGVAEAFAEGR